MALREELEKQGNWLFRWRSYLPLLIVPLFITALYSSVAARQDVAVFGVTIWEGFCFLLSMLGLAIRCLTVGLVPEGTSGRNTQEQIADELNVTGIYSIVRHPLYLGNLTIIFGLLLFIKVFWFAALGGLLFLLYYERIAFAEEEFLRRKFGASYLEWADKTPALLPRFRNWSQPTLTFSLRKVLKDEYSGFFALIASFCSLVLIRGILTNPWNPPIAQGWVLLFCAGLITYLTLRTLKKKTKFLEPPRKN
jgi:protein-S-isoprenylcysteine O-methyltransferase Ste14